MKYLIFLLILGQSAMLFPQTGARTPPADIIIKKVDENRLTDSKVIVSKMIIHGQRVERTVEAKSWQRNIDDSFTEYLAPAREKGTKMLKLGDQLWIYSPSTDRTILISGHMLRQSVMGSDLSYQDMMEDPFLQNMYTAKVTGAESYAGCGVWVLELSAKIPNAAYETRKIWVDAERFITLKEQLFAKSGTLLKQIDVREVMQSEGRWLQKSALFKDVLKDGDGTELLIESISFDEKITEYIFSKAALRKQEVPPGTNRH